ncbi:MAG: hypothetical protein KatS3mg115_0161 [Candidatus Poribacteria bacterium]|nr:MAG: hypothetical protein KatS3mg115_0161 [Candidatus Poribacteria bacterium]
MNTKTLIGLGVAALLAALLWPTGSSQKVKTLFEDAEALLQQQRYQDAIAKYQEALLEAEKPLVKTEVIDPDFQTLANYKIAYAYTQIAEQTGDVTAYDKALEIVEPLYQRATLPKHREVVTFLWGYILFKQEKLEEAEPKFREVIDNFPNSLYLENAWYSIAQINYQLKEYDEAREAYTMIVNQFPNSTFRDDAQYMIGQTFLLEENWEQAARAFDQLTPENFPNSPLHAEAAYKAAYCMLQLNRLQEAIDRYNRFLTSFPDSPLVTAAYFDLGTIYTRQKDYDTAIQNYQLAIETTEDMMLRAEIQYEIGDNYLEAGDYLNAAEAYRTVVELYPDSPFVPQARYGVGEAYMRLANENSSPPDEIDTENYLNAIAAFQEVLNEHPGSELEPHATFQIAEAYYQLQDFNSALQWYETVLQRFPEDPLAPYALYGALWSLAELGRYDELIERGRAFVQAHADDPDFDLQAAEIQMKLGDIMFDQEEYLKAAEEYARVIAFPDLPKFYAVKLRSYYQQGVSYFQAAETTGDRSFYEQAIPPLTEAINRYSDDVFNLDYEFPERRSLWENAIMTKAHVHEKLEQWQQARETYALIPRDSENYGRAVILTAETYEKEGNIDEAINRYRAIAQDQGLNETWRSLGAIRLADLLRAEERWEEAAQAYADIIQQYPNSEYVDAAQYLIGVCYYSIEPRTAENLRRSIQEFQKLLEQFPNSSNAPDALYGIVLSTKALAEMGEASWAEVVQLADELAQRFGDRTDERARSAVTRGNLLKVVALEKIGSQDIDSMVASLRQVVESDAADPDAKLTAQLKIGNLLFQAERYDEAAPEYAKIGELFPQDEQAPIGYYQAAVSAFKHAERIEESDENAAAAFYRQAAEYATKALDYQLDTNMLVSVNYTRGAALAKSGNVMEAIDALNAAIALEDQVTDPQRKGLVEAARAELAQLYEQLGQYDQAIAQYLALAEKGSTNDLQTRSYFSAAQLYRDQLGDLEKAAEAFVAAADISENVVLAANGLYQAGLLYSDLYDSTQDQAMAQKAIEVFERLQQEYQDLQDQTVQLMVADAGVRASDLYVRMGSLDAAIQRAAQARDRAMQTGDLVQKVQAQYQYANLLAQQARTLFDPAENAPNTEYRQASRVAIQEFLRVVELAEPIAQAPESVRLFVGPAIFQAGAIAYSIHGPNDLPVAVDALRRFVQLADSGLIEANPDDIKNALYYTGVSLYRPGPAQRERPGPVPAVGSGAPEPGGSVPERSGCGALAVSGR